MVGDPDLNAFFAGRKLGFGVLFFKALYVRVEPVASDSAVKVGNVELRLRLVDLFAVYNFIAAASGACGERKTGRYGAYSRGDFHYFLSHRLSPLFNELRIFTI